VFADLNIWADVVAVLMIMAPLGFWSFQIAGNTFTGRYRRKFIEKQWPHHDEVVPFSPKFMHAINLTMMIALGVSGMYLRFPFFAAGRDSMKLIHFVCMYILIINAAFRVRYALKKDGGNFIITMRDIVNAPKVLLYYTFITKSYPHLTKYNIMQKSTYGYMFPALLVIQTITGFAMIWPQYIFSWSADFFGGITSAMAWFRLAHFLSAMAFLMMTMIHAFLAITEDLPAFLDFFGIVKHKPHADHGTDNHGTHKDNPTGGFKAPQGSYRKSGSQVYRERGI
jgi:thiosulfate reductase cytochrome b subunit